MRKWIISLNYESTVFADDKAIALDLTNVRSAMNGVDILLGTDSYMRLVRLTLDLLFLRRCYAARFRSTSGKKAVSRPNRGKKAQSWNMN
jgi:hypothetical protein